MSGIVRSRPEPRPQGAVRSGHDSASRVNRSLRSRFMSSIVRCRREPRPQGAVRSGHDSASRVNRSLRSRFMSGIVRSRPEPRPQGAVRSGHDSASRVNRSLRSRFMSSIVRSRPEPRPQGAVRSGHDSRSRVNRSLRSRFRSGVIGSRHEPRPQGAVRSGHDSRSRVNRSLRSRFMSGVVRCRREPRPQGAVRSPGTRSGGHIMSSPLVAPPVVKTRSLHCPNCGGPVQLRGFGHALTVVCQQCLTILDASTPELQILQKVEERYRVTPDIPLGTRGKMAGATWEAIGFQARTVYDEGTAYTWHEYLLFNPYKGFRYLTQYEGHWNFVTPLESQPTRMARMGRPAVAFEN